MFDATKPMFTHSVTIRLKQIGIRQSQKLIPRILNVATVKVINLTASFFGKSLQGELLAVLFKVQKNPSEVALASKPQFSLVESVTEEQLSESNEKVIVLDMKCSSKELAEAASAILQEALQI